MKERRYVPNPICGSAGWQVRHYRYKADDYAAIYYGRCRLGVLEAKREMLEFMAAELGAEFISLGDVGQRGEIHCVEHFYPMLMQKVRVNAVHDDAELEAPGDHLLGDDVTAEQ